MFLKLTKLSGAKVRVSSEHISYYHLWDGGTLIVFQNDKDIQVNEQPEEIDRLLASAYVTIKEAYENRTTEVPQHPTNSQLDDSK